MLEVNKQGRNIWIHLVHQTVFIRLDVYLFGGIINIKLNQNNVFYTKDVKVTDYGFYSCDLYWVLI